MIMLTFLMCSSFFHYNHHIRGHIHFFSNLYLQYIECQKHYSKLSNALFHLPERVHTKQTLTLKNIQLKELTYTYPDKKFGIQLMNPLDFKPGQIILLAGDSGHGKSTFTDVICGVIPQSEYNHVVYLDTERATNAFDQLLSASIYVEQFENIHWKSSVYEIVTAQVSTTNISISIERMVWQALKLACCEDFLTLYPHDHESNLKWIHIPNINPSGGQKGRIAIARSIYHVIKKQPKILVLDEIDKQIQAKQAVKIMMKIFDLCQQNHILCLVIAHSTEVQNLNYDQTISFNHGQISLV